MIPTYKAWSKRMNERNKRGLCIHWVRTIDPCERCKAGDQEEIIEDPNEPQGELFTELHNEGKK